jgi:hypothetical protein
LTDEREEQQLDGVCAGYVTAPVQTS